MTSKSELKRLASSAPEKLVEMYWKLQEENKALKQEEITLETECPNCEALIVVTPMSARHWQDRAQEFCAELSALKKEIEDAPVIYAEKGQYEWAVDKWVWEDPDGNTEDRTVFKARLVRIESIEGEKK